jgi:hypothetical protein
VSTGFPQQDLQEASLAAERREAEELHKLQTSNLLMLASFRKKILNELHDLEIAHLEDVQLAQVEAYDEWLAEFEDAKAKREQQQKDSAKESMKEINALLFAMGATAEQIKDSSDEAIDNRLQQLAAVRDQAIRDAGGDAEAIEKAKAEYKEKAKQEEKFRKNRQKAEEAIAKKNHKKRMAEAKDIASAVYTSPTSLFTNTAAAKAAIAEKGIDPSSDEGKQMLFDAQTQAVSGMVSNYLDQLSAKGKEISSHQSAVDTRLQGSHYGAGGVGAWSMLDLKVGAAVGVSPFVKQEKVFDNLRSMIDKGIAFNVEQRAFLETISEKIATTFNAADSTLLKLVRIQQADTTAARLGMESALTAFLNNMYETTEYMTEAAATIRASIYEASALMEAEEATAFEYQVQKWMGSLHSVGFSNAEGLASAFGKLASGDISGITDGGYGNLLTMAATAAGMSVADILEKGITDDQTNMLFESMVDYLSKIYNESKGSKVVMQQYANVYGLTASDLKAAANLSNSLTDISKNDLDYSGMMSRLDLMSNTMFLRTSMSEMMHNLMDNFTYTMAASMGNNPALYLTHEMAKMLKDTTGGIDLPFLNIYGFGVDLNTTVADLMEVAALSGTVLGGMGKLVASLAGGGGLVGSGMLRMMGIGGGSAEHTTRGSGSLLTLQSGSTVSESGYIGNESSEDIKSKTVSDASQEPESQVAEAKQEMADIKLEQVDEHVVDIYNLLLDVANGSKTLSVKLKVGDVPSAWTTATW